MTDFLQKSIFALLRMDDQQMGTDLPEKRKTRLPFSPSPFWKPVNAVWIFHFKMAAMLQIPRVFPLVSCLASAKAIQCPRSEPNIGDKSRQVPCYFPVCSRGQPLEMAADKCIKRQLHCPKLLSWLSPPIPRGKSLGTRLLACR